MANLKFLKGLYENLNQADIVEGQILITKDTGEMFVDVAAGQRLKIGDFTVVDTIAALEALDATKVPTSRLYYVSNGNILARSNGTAWVQINKQPTTEEMKTLLGLGSLAYKSEVAEGDLNADLKAKINASTETNHSHTNKAELDKIADGDVAKWNAAEQNAKGYADGLNTAMNTRVEALEAIDHTHANKALLDTYTQTEENLADAVAKKHEHTNKTELDKIAAGDVAKWNAVVADHLVAADKTELSDAIGDVNTALGEEITRAKAAEKANADAITGIKNGASINDFAGTEAALSGKVDKVTGKSLVDDAQITKLTGVSEGANKVEASTTNGNIKIDGVETTVYTHPEKHAIADVTGLQDALNGFQAKGDYAAEDHTHVKADITDFAHTHTASEITDLGATIEGYNYATKTELGNVDAKFADYKTAADQKVIDDEQDRRLGVIEGDYLKAADIADFETKENVKKVADDLDAYKTANDAALADVKSTADAAAVKTEVNAALALKADKSVVDAMYTNDQIDGFIADAKKYADDNDANTTYTIGYESKVDGEGGHPARIVLTPSEGAAQYVDATPFIKDGMLDNVAYNEATNTLTFTFNTDAGKEAVTVELTDILAPYTGSTGDRVKVEVTDGVISADLIAGSIGKDYLDADVKASLALADTALQSHQDISHLATKEELNAAKTETANQDAVILSEAQKYADAAQADAEAKAAELDAALKSELQSEIDADVKVVSDALAQYKTDNDAAVALKANTADVYAKTETYNKTEIDNLITWVDF